MKTLLFVAALAVAWHIGLALFERSRRPEQGGPSLAKLLLLAEADLLRTLRCELKRCIRFGRDSRGERKLLEVEKRLEEIGEKCAVS